MREIIETVLHNAENATGEACLEFLLALAGDKLRLAERDEELLQKHMVGLGSASVDCMALISRIFKGG
jgi:hypothetical protein